jgi:hypothetical protein
MRKLWVPELPPRYYSELAQKEGPKGFCERGRATIRLIELK